MKTIFQRQPAFEDSGIPTKLCIGGQRSRSHTGVRLLVRLDARRNPNRQDHLMRVAEANALSGIAELTVILGVRYMALVSMSSTELNGLLAGTPLHVVSPGSAEIRGMQASRYGLSQDARICPQCVAEDMPQPQVFNFSIPVRCPIHKILPLDFCPSCMCSLSYLRRTVSRCNCGYQFATAENQSRPMWLQLLYSIFAPWHLTGFAENEFRTIASNDYRAAELLLLLLGDKKDAQRRRITSKDFNELESFFANWKNKFRLAIAPYFEKNSQVGNSNFLKRLSRHNEVLNKSVISAGLSFSASQISIKNAQQEIQKNEISASVVRKKAKLDAKAMRQYLLSIEPASVRTFAVSGRKFRTINSSGVKDVEKYLDGTLNIQDASTYLGYSVPDLRALAKVGFVKSQMLAVKPRSPRFLKDCLDAWLHILARASVEITTRDEKLVRLVDIAAHQSCGGIRRTWVRLMQKIQTRQIVLSLLGPPSQASNFYVNYQDLVEIGFLKVIQPRLLTKAKQCS